jgi:mRNA interferase RelE/StbE
MPWKIVLTETVEKQIDALDPVVRRRVLSFLRERLEKLPDPRLIGEPLTGPRNGHWRYRVGDYRLICKIIHGELVVLVLEIGHRREVYK